MSLSYIQDYLADLARVKRVSGSNKETIVREAFKDLLKRYARQRDLVFVAEYPLVTNRKKNISVDGALVHSLRLPLGYYEAKDEEDDIDEEIDKKFRAGYPQDNIIFEDTREAVLIQNKELVMRCPIEDATKLAELLKHFFDYEQPAIADFRKAVEQFARDLPAITSALNDLIETAGRDNPDYKHAEAKFLAHAKETINPTVTLADIREMLMQHILTEEIFAHVFADADFHRENNVARELYALERTFFKEAVKRETLKSLDPYYTAIKANAAQITTHSEKQKFLKTIYENFYKVYNPKAADRLGVVYTPNEIVKFMIDGADWLCQTHFGKSLIDQGVEILDPATGTGTFVCELLEKFSGSPAKLDRKYREEIHANEVAILPYYVANLNIEATFYTLNKQYAAYPNLCFVDTLDNVAGLGKFSGYQGDMFGAVSDENIARIKRQNERKISVVIGNPPYNANQQNENDNNKNRTYNRIDQRIKATYIAESTAQKTKAYDMYTRFFRWASDRIKDEGIVAFVTNRSFIDARTMDGFRKIAARDFSEIRIVDLGGDVRANPKLSGTKNNVFGIQTGVAISFLVRRKNQDGKCRLFYTRRPELETSEEKLNFLSSSSLDALKFDEITPDPKANWLGQTSNDFETFIPVATKDTKAAKTSGQERAIFKLYSLGVSTNRDEWVYDFDSVNLDQKMTYFDQQIRTAKSTNSDFPGNLKSSSTLSQKYRNSKNIYKNKIGLINSSLYRLFTIKNIFISDFYIDRLGSYEEVFERGSNLIIGFTVGGRLDFEPFASKSVPSLTVLSLDANQYLPLYRYTSSGERIDNITDWALAEFQKAYANPSPGRVEPRARKGGEAECFASERGVPAEQGGEGLAPAASNSIPSSVASRDTFSLREKDAKLLTKNDIFHYVYAVLHDPLYREKYALNLKREFPRIPFYPDFFQWAAWGERLMALHTGFETIEPWLLTRIDATDEKAKAAGLKPKPILKSNHESGHIVLDSETQLTGIPLEVWHYRLGNRTALDWILDQYKEKTPKDPTIRERFNTYRFADYKEKVIDLLTRVTRVSVETVEITEAMKQVKR